MFDAGAGSTVSFVTGEPGQRWFEAGALGRLVPVFALAIALVAAITQPSSAVDLVLAAIPVIAFAVWAFVPRIPLLVLTVAVAVPVVLAQRRGDLEPIMFEASLLGFVVGRWSPSLAASIPLGLLAVATPVFVAAVQDPAEVAVAIWILGIVFPWVLGRALARQQQLVGQLEGTRRELARQELLAERRRIAGDVHDFVGHGLAAVMLQVTSARHVLRRDPDAAEDALRSAEEVGRRSMQELRRTVTLLRSDEETVVAPPRPSAADVPALVDQARAAGLDVNLRMLSDVSRISPGVSAAVYRISQEALANAARHAPSAYTELGLDLTDGCVAIVAETRGPLVAPSAAERGRPRYGLIGMQERATALGGEFAAGPTTRGWLLRCTLPIDGGPGR
jgi:signal transduction histidine kinase